MTYGFKFLNNNNERIIDDSSVKPWFLQQAPVLSTTLLDPAYYANLLNQTDAEGNPFSSFVPEGSGITSWAVYNISYSTPAAYKGFLLFALPNTSKYIFYESQDPSNVSSYTSVSIRAYVPNTAVATSADIPKAYMFIGEAIPTAQLGTGYGVQIFNATAQCMFDTNKRHLQPAQYPYIFISDLGDKYNSSNPLGPAVTSNVGQLILDANYAMPGNPAFLLPGINRSWVYPYNGNWYSTYIPTLYKKVFNSGDLLRAEPATFRLPVSAPDAPGMYGPTSQATKTIVLNATPLDQGYTPPELPQSYILTKTVSGIQESQGGLYTTYVITIYLTTSGVPDGTVVPYTISGTNITASDFTSNSLTGNFVVSSNNALVYLTATSDGLIENTETATLSLNNGKASTSFTITDAVSYSLSSFMTPEEGQSITVTLTTQGLQNGSTVPYTITGITQADLSVGTISGNFTISGNTSGLEFRFARDASTESETMRISVNNGTTFLDIPITDVPAGNEVLTISPSTFNYDQRTSITITGGTPNGSFEFTSVPQGIDPVYAWNNRWKPEYSTVGTAYFDENGNFSNPPYTALGPTGSDLGGNPNSTVNRTFWIFTTTTKNFRSFNYTINPAQTFSITGSNGTKGPLTISETSTGYFKVTTTNVPTGTLVYPKFINTNLNASDYTNSAASGVAVNSSGIANFSIEFTADQTTDGTKTGELVVQYPNGTTKDSYGVITVLDASQTPPGYTLSKYVASVDENGFQFFTIGWTNVPAGTQLWWDISGTNITPNDIQYVYHNDPTTGDGWQVPSGGSTLNNTFVTNPDGIFQVIVYPRSDLQTESNETAVFNLRAGSSSATPVASTSFIINDTSVAPTPVTYNEVVTIVSDNSQDYRVELNNYMTISVTGGMSGGAFVFKTTANGDPEPTFTTGIGTGTLTTYSPDTEQGVGEVGGRFTNHITGATARGSQTVGDFRLWFKFNYSNNVRSARYQVVYDAGTNNGGTYCVGTTLYQNKNDGLGGTYQQVVQTNSPTCQTPVTQYYPTTSASNYYYYKATNTYDNFIVNGAKPGGTVRFNLTSGIYQGVSYNRTATDPGGVATYDPGVGDYTAGTYSGNITFPGQDADYPIGYRALPITWIVVAANAPPPSLTVTGYSFTKSVGWEDNIDVYGSPSAAYDGLRVRGTDSVSGEGINSIDKQVTRTFTTNVACTISYRLTVSSEAAYDFGYFYIDGVEKIKRAGLDVAGGEAGTGPYLTMALAAGTHTIKIRYTKDGSQTMGGDNAFGEYSLAV